MFYFVAVDSNQGRDRSVDERWHATRLFARRISMMDAVMMAIGFVGFALSIAYVHACDQL
jgi:hypothetical protein